MHMDYLLVWSNIQQQGLEVNMYSLQSRMNVHGSK